MYYSIDAMLGTGYKAMCIFIISFSIVRRSSVLLLSFYIKCVFLGGRDMTKTAKSDLQECWSWFCCKTKTILLVTIENDRGGIGICYYRVKDKQRDSREHRSEINVEKMRLYTRIYIYGNRYKG